MTTLLLRTATAKAQVNILIAKATIRVNAVKVQNAIFISRNEQMHLAFAKNNFIAG
jgi:hypothetical protein